VVAAHRVVMVALQLGSCAQGCHGYPTHSALVLEAPVSFQAPSPSSSIVDEFNCFYKPWNKRHVKEFQNEPIPRELNLILYLLNNHDNFHASYLLV